MSLTIYLWNINSEKKQLGKSFAGKHFLKKRWLQLMPSTGSCERLLKSKYYFLAFVQHNEIQSYFDKKLEPNNLIWKV